MFTYIDDEREISVPGWVTDLESFRRWTDSDEFPEQGKIWWLGGEVWIDMTREQIFTHVGVKTELTAALAELTKEQPGLYLGPGARLSNEAGDFSVTPDGLYFFHETRRCNRLQFIQDKDGVGYDELCGTPDMVLEIISDSSEQKDDVELRQAYWEAGIPEFWIVDTREEPLRFDILRRTARGYTNTRKQDGWVKSAVFGKAFRLLVLADEFSDPEYTLEVR